MRTLQKLTAIILSTLLFTACGGGDGGAPNPGGDGSGGPSGTPGPGSTTEIGSLTLDNAGLIAFVAMINAKNYAMNLQLQGGLQLLLAGFALTDAKLEGLGNSDTQSCTNGGSKTWTFTDADGDTFLSTGDTWAFEQTNCSEEADGIANGSWVINFVDFNPDRTPLASYDEFEFVTDLSGTSFSDPYTFRGTYNMISATPDDIVTTQIISSDSIVTTLYGGTDSTLSNFYVSTIRNKSTLAETLEFRGKISDEMIASYKLETKTPLTGIDVSMIGGIEMYYEGEFTVTLDTGSVNLFVLSATDVRIGVDLDGDGFTDETFDTTWNDLTLQYFDLIGLGSFSGSGFSS